MNPMTLSYPAVAGRTRFVLDGAGWKRARLGQDDEAMAWLAELESDRRGSVAWCELLGESALRFHQLLNTIWACDVRFLSCTCVPRYRCRERDDDWLTVRRRYTGPVPPQVLAAFEARP
jgi:hypothetical protein